MNTRKTLAVLCFGAVLALAGCGESGSKSEPDTASSSEAAASYEETASSEAEASSEAADESTVQQPSADDSAAEQPSEGIMTDAGIEVSIEGGYIGTEYRKLKESGDDHLSAKTYYDAEGKAVLEVGYKSEEYHSYKTYKYDDEGRLIEEFYHDEYSVFKTDENGHGLSGLLAFGEYEVRETITPNDRIETVEPFYININKDSNGSIKEFVENDLPFEAYVKLIKEDKTTGKKVTLSNATFKLYRLNDKNQWEKVYCKNGIFKVDSWKTGKDGVAYTEDKLIAGKYKADEILEALQINKQIQNQNDKIKEQIKKDNSKGF